MTNPDALRLVPENLIATPAIRNALGLFASAIKSGESWSAVCQEKYLAALTELDKLAAIAAAPAVQPAAGITPADVKWLDRWLRDQKDGGHCGEGNVERMQRRAWNDRIDRILAAISTPAQASEEIHGEVTDEWAERFCEAVNWSPDGQECKTVEGEFRCVSFRDLAKGYILSAIATNPHGAHPPAQASESGGEDSAFKIASDLHAAYEQLIYGLPRYLEAENLTDEENMIREAYITLDVTAHRLATLSAPQAAPGEGERS